MLLYVIAAVSGSGAIEAVPLAIFAVSAIVPLISAIYLIRPVVSRAGDKKEVGLNGEKSGHTASQEPQKSACENSTNLENKPGVPTPQPPPVTLDVHPSGSIPLLPPPPFPQGAAPPPLPPEGLKNWSLSKNNLIGKKSSVGATKKPLPLVKNTNPRKIAGECLLVMILL